MIVEQAVLERLKAVGPVAALVGTRVYQLVLPQHPTLPAIRVQLIDQPLTYHLRGGATLTRARVQIDAVAQEGSGVDPYAAAATLADAIDAAISGQRWRSTDSPSSLHVRGGFRDSRRPFYESGELRLVRMMQDYLIWATAA